MEKINVEQVVREIMEYTRPDVDFDKEKDLISGGVLESIDIVEIVAQIEDRLGVTIMTSELVEENFKSYESVVFLVRKVMGAE